MRISIGALAIMAVSLVGFAGCGDGGSESDRLGVGAECADDTNCQDGQTCLTNFKGGYCGVTGCNLDSQCPTDSACVTADDALNYCFLTCATKSECNANRSPAYEANCSSSVTWADPNNDGKGKACVPPSG